MPHDYTTLSRADEYREQEADKTEATLKHYEACRDSLLMGVTALYNAEPHPMKMGIIAMIEGILENIQYCVFGDYFPARFREDAELIADEKTFLGMKQRMDDYFHNTLTELRGRAGV